MHAAGERQNLNNSADWVQVHDTTAAGKGKEPLGSTSSATGREKDAGNLGEATGLKMVENERIPSTSPHACMMWCAIALGGLVRGAPLSNVGVVATTYHVRFGHDFGAIRLTVVPQRSDCDDSNCTISDCQALYFRLLFELRVFDTIDSAYVLVYA